MYRIKCLALGMSLVSVLWSCNNDLEIFTEPVDLPFIYGIITSNDTAHYVKVTRTYQKWYDEIDLSDMYYEDDSVQVYIDEYDGENLIKSHHALPVIATDKEEGIFPYPTHKYYKLENTLLSNQTGHRFSIRVELANGVAAKNQTPFSLQRNIDVDWPNLELQHSIVEIGFKDPSGNSTPCKFHWRQSGGGREELILTVMFQETNIETNITDTVAIPISVYNDIPTDKNGNATGLLGLEKMLNRMAWHLEKSDKYRRRMLNTKIEHVGPFKEIVGFGVGIDVWSESRDLTTYETIIYSATQEGISKDIPNYSNLENALGMFSSRSHKGMSPLKEYLYFNDETLDSLACSQLFYEYNFARSFINNMGELEFDESKSRCK